MIVFIGVIDDIEFKFLISGEAVSQLWLIGENWVDVPFLLGLVGLSGNIESALDDQFALDVGVEVLLLLELMGDDWKQCSRVHKCSHGYVDIGDGYGGHE